MVKLSNRLQTLCSFVPQNSFVADVGADHGKLGIYLLENHIINKVQSIENKKGPFSIMVSNYEAYNLSDKAIFSLSDGLTELNKDVNCLVIAGMGGLLINKIISANVDKALNVGTIIVDPHKDTYQVRKYITSLGFMISDEQVIYESKKYYFLIKFIKSDAKITYSEDEYYYGPINLKNKTQIFLNYLNEELKLTEELLNKNLSSKRKTDYQAKIERIKRYL